MSKERRAKELSCDRLFSRIIVSRGICQAQRFVTRGAGIIECWGPLECAHLLRRRFKSSGLRWDTDNAASLCQRHHGYLDGNREELERFMATLLSPARLEELQARAYLRIYDRADIDEVLMRLRREVITNRG